VSQLEHRSFRLPKRLLTRLRKASDQRGVSQTALVERYLEEGLKLDAFPLIVFRDSPVGRRAMLEGTRLDVAQVMETVRNEKGSVEAAARYLGLSDAQVRACVRYYAENRPEVDAYTRRVSEETERLRGIWEREQQLLAG
jgi:uncharacterized protein (DUF433 family)